MIFFSKKIKLCKILKFNLINMGVKQIKEKQNIVTKML